MEKSVVTTTAISVIDFTILEKGFNNIIKAKILHYNKTEIPPQPKKLTKKQQPKFKR